MVAEKNQFIKSIFKYIIAQSRLQRGLGSEQHSEHNSNSSAEFPLCEISYSVQPFQDSCLWNKHNKRQGDAK